MKDLYRIKSIVSKFYGITPSDLNYKTRKREIVECRQIGMYYGKMFTKRSLSQIGLVMGGKDHATVLYSIRVVNNLIDTDKDFRLFCDNVKSRILEEIANPNLTKVMVKIKIKGEPTNGKWKYTYNKVLFEVGSDVCEVECSTAYDAVTGFDMNELDRMDISVVSIDPEPQPELIATNEMTEVNIMKQHDLTNW